MTSTSTLVNQVYKSRQTILDLLKRQGCDISDYEGFSVNEINSMIITTQLDMLIENPEKQSKCYVKYYLEKSLRPTNIHDCIEDLYILEKILKPNDDLIIIIKDPPNDTLIGVIKDIWEQDKINVIIFGIKHLLFNILEHSYVPSHTVLKESEKDELFKRLNILSPDKLPEISRFDSVSKAIGLRPGEVCLIERKSPTALTASFYRYCV